MNNRVYDYGVLIQNTLVKDLQQKLQQKTALLGSIVKIEGVLGNRTFALRFLQDDRETWESEKFCCEQEKIVSISETFWPHLAAVNSPQERVKLAKNSVWCEQLMQVSVGSLIGYLSSNEVLLGTVTYIGNVIGRGKCFGIRLHEKKINNQCNGSSAGVQYFECLPGYGIFTTVENIVPQNIPSVTSKGSTQLSSLSHLLNDLTDRKATANGTTNNCDKYKKPTQDVNSFKYDRQSYSNEKSRNSNNFRTSLSLQNILEPGQNLSVNTNNDFDQNTILQPDSTYLINSKNKNLIQSETHKSEIDLIDAIGGVWTSSNKLENSTSNFGKPVEKPLKTSPTTSDSILKNSRNKSINPVSHLISGSKTVPRKVKLFQENSVNKDVDRNMGAKKNVVEGKINQNYSEQRKSAPVQVHYDSPTPGTTNDLTVGTLVEISNDISQDPLYGVIRWMGAHPISKEVLVGVELEEEQIHLPLTLSDGVFNEQRFFKCSENRGLFVPLNQCHKDSRFMDENPTSTHHVADRMFGREIDCPIVKGIVAPLCMPTEDDVEAVCGKFRGIQGHHNSCYLDATLFAMFTFTGVFDGVLFRPKGLEDIPYYEEVQQVLREEIVNPLRTNLFVRADRVMNLRKLLDQLSSVSGLTSEEKDPEEFLHSLLAQILKAEPFLKLSSGQEAYHYQLFVEKDDGLTLPSVQQLFEQSFLTSDIKLTEVPSCLIIQMPRFGKNYKMYPRILPSQLLDVTDIIENSPRQCTVCGKLALWECKQCFGECGIGLESTAFCHQCIEKAHSHSRRISHNPKKLNVSQDFSIMAEHCHPPRLFMELFAVICIETSHYVAFVKCGVGHEAPWCFFDSMADRKGEQNGYNIPEMVACPDVSKWLSDEQICRALNEEAPSDRYLPEHARRLLCDAYICMYQSPDVMMYR